MVLQIYTNDFSVCFSFCCNNKENLNLFSQFFFQKECTHVSTVFQTGKPISK